jgi:hypothetical protein
VIAIEVNHPNRSVGSAVQAFAGSRRHNPNRLLGRCGLEREKTGACARSIVDLLFATFSPLWFLRDSVEHHVRVEH